MAALRGRFSGLCQPPYVLDIPGGHGKAPIGPDALSPSGASVTDYKGVEHAYPPAAGFSVGHDGRKEAAAAAIGAAATPVIVVFRRIGVFEGHEFAARPEGSRPLRW